MSHNSDFSFVPYDGYTRQERVNNLKVLIFAFSWKNKNFMRQTANRETLIGRRAWQTSTDILYEVLLYHIFMWNMTRDMLYEHVPIIGTDCNERRGGFSAFWI